MSDEDKSAEIARWLYSVERAHTQEDGSNRELTSSSDTLHHSPRSSSSNASSQPTRGTSPHRLTRPSPSIPASISTHPTRGSSPRHAPILPTSTSTRLTRHLSTLPPSSRAGQSPSSSPPHSGSPLPSPPPPPLSLPSFDPSPRVTSRRALGSIGPAHSADLPTSTAASPYLVISLTSVPDRRHTHGDLDLGSPADSRRLCDVGGDGGVEERRAVVEKVAEEERWAVVEEVVEEESRAVVEEVVAEEEVSVEEEREPVVERETRHVVEEERGPVVEEVAVLSEDACLGLMSTPLSDDSLSVPFVESDQRHPLPPFPLSSHHLPPSHPHRLSPSHVLSPTSSHHLPPSHPHRLPPPHALSSTSPSSTAPRLALHRLKLKGMRAFTFDEDDEDVQMLGRGEGELDIRFLSRSSSTVAVAATASSQGSHSSGSGGGSGSGGEGVGGGGGHSREFALRLASLDGAGHLLLPPGHAPQVQEDHIKSLVGHSLDRHSNTEHS